MDWSMKFLFTVFLIAVVVNGANGDASVTGSVFCDQCKDGHVTLFDYPLQGVKVGITCLNNAGQVALQKEETTDWLGSYSMTFNGAPDLRGCQARILGPSQGSNACGAVPGPAQNFRLLFNFFGMEMYSVDPLISQPSQPMSACQNSKTSPVVNINPPVPPSPVYVPVPTPPATIPPVLPSPPPPVAKNPPSFRLPTPPPPPSSPPPLLPPLPFLDASACPYWKWTMPEHKCYWKVVNPNTKVAVAFGLIAARRFGTDMTLSMALQGKGEPYRTLLREATTALLNSYNTFQFLYHPLSVIQDFNMALMASKQQVMHTALRFKRANSGNGKLQCKFTPCK